MQGSSLTGHAPGRPPDTARAQLVVGILSFCDSPFMGPVTTEADRGLTTWFPDFSRAIIHCDCRTQETTGNAFLDVHTQAPKFQIAPTRDPDNHRANILALLRTARELGAEAILILETDIRNITPDWIRRMIDPMLQGFDFVAPVHPQTRRVDDLANHIVYPFMRALYGKRVRQPIGHAFGLSPRLADIMLKESPRVPFRRSGLGIQLATYAIVHGLNVCQTFLEEQRIYTASEAPGELFPEFADAVETLFALMVRFHRVWKDVRWSKPIVTLNAQASPRAVPAHSGPDPALLYQRFQEGLLCHAGMIEKVLRPDVFKKLYELAGAPAETFEFPSLLWAMVLFDFSLACKRHKAPPDQLVPSLMPLFFGMVCSSSLSTAQMGPHQREVYVDQLCQTIEETKPYLDFLWHKH